MSPDSESVGGVVERLLWARGIKPVIAKRGVEHGSGLRRAHHQQTTVEAVGISLAATPGWPPSCSPPLAEPVCQHCGAHASCTHLGRDLELGAIGERPMAA